MKIITLKGKDIVERKIGSEQSGADSAKPDRSKLENQQGVTHGKRRKKTIADEFSNRAEGRAEKASQAKSRSKTKRSAQEGVDPEVHIENKAVFLLARREHSEYELSNKLLKSDFDSSLIGIVLSRLVAEGLLSDERFTEAYVRMRRNKGFGPVKIRVELKGKGVAEQIIDDHLQFGSPEWIDYAMLEYKKKYGDAPVTDYNQWTKRARFMQSRGFTNEQIRVALPDAEFY